MASTVVFASLDALTNNGGGNFSVNSTGLDIAPFTVTFTTSIPVGSTFSYTDGNGASFSGTYDGTNSAGDLIFNNGGSFQVLTNQTYTIGQTITSTENPFVCFAAGTLIRTPTGDVAIETLKAGDLVLTASGEMRPVKWIGHADCDFRRTLLGTPGQPIRIAADAFGPARPSHDLYASVGHSVCVDLVGEVLIPVGCLVNGSTVAPIEVEEISYWHVELDSHDILVANNLPAESYLAMGNRGGFEELRGLLPAVLEGRYRTYADFCRPVITEGPVLDFVRQRLNARAEDIGWTPVRDADLHLVVDGDIVRPLIDGGEAAFQFPAGAKDVRLMSSTFSPASFGSPDPRLLGVMLSGLAIAGSQISLDDARLRDGVSHVENHAVGLRRWTNGALALDPQFWEGLSGQVALVVNTVTTIRGWAAPPAPKRKAGSSQSRPKLYAVG